MGGVTEQGFPNADMVVTGALGASRTPDAAERTVGHKMVEVLQCPITNLLLVDPVVLKDSGYVFSRKALDRYLDTCASNPKCPVTQISLRWHPGGYYVNDYKVRDLVDTVRRLCGDEPVHIDKSARGRRRDEDDALDKYLDARHYYRVAKVDLKREEARRRRSYRQLRDYRKRRHDEITTSEESLSASQSDSTSSDGDRSDSDWDP